LLFFFVVVGGVFCWFGRLALWQVFSAAIRIESRLAQPRAVFSRWSEEFRTILERREAFGLLGRYRSLKKTRSIFEIFLGL
jgi:hypothetical protein